MHYQLRTWMRRACLWIRLDASEARAHQVMRNLDDEAERLSSRSVRDTRGICLTVGAGVWQWGWVVPGPEVSPRCVGWVEFVRGVP